LSEFAEEDSNVHLFSGRGQAPPGFPGGGISAGAAGPPLVVDAGAMTGTAGVVNINDVLGDHVALEVECVERLLVNVRQAGFDGGFQARI
jgi:hypothetical protein